MTPSRASNRRTPQILKKGKPTGPFRRAWRRTRADRRDHTRRSDRKRNGGIKRLVVVDQKAIGRTPRSHLATYTGLFDYVRKIFAATKSAHARRYDAGRFSFNIAKGPLRDMRLCLRRIAVPAQC